MKSDSRTFRWEWLGGKLARFTATQYLAVVFLWLFHMSSEIFGYKHFDVIFGFHTVPVIAINLSLIIMLIITLAAHALLHHVRFVLKYPGAYWPLCFVFLNLGCVLFAFCLAADEMLRVWPAVLLWVSFLVLSSVISAVHDATAIKRPIEILPIDQMTGKALPVKFFGNLNVILAAVSSALAIMLCWGLVS